MKVGDLVKYNYGTVRARRGFTRQEYWGVKKGELGVIVNACWKGDADVAEILWFNEYGLQTSFKKYLEIISDG